MSTAKRLLVHHLQSPSQANGPGLRAVLWTQGCTLACPGCFNPETHSFKAGRRMTVEDILGFLRSPKHEIEGLTVSGGEPFQQAPALGALLQAVRRETSLSILVFSGYTLEELRTIPGAGAALSAIDVLIAGRYRREQHNPSSFLASSNQQAHFLTQRYSPGDLNCLPDGEIWVEPGGDILLSGINPVLWPSTNGFEI